ncbi:MAG: hypothetical protein K6T17_04030 [Fimbriimonadales bacterium]|nr:hypothetical protein [Fimbriimonadales bacterium]
MSLILLGVAVGMFLVGWLGSGSGMVGNLRGLLAFDTSYAWREPWRWVTYVLLNFDLFILDSRPPFWPIYLLLLYHQGMD